MITYRLITERIRIYGINIFLLYLFLTPYRSFTKPSTKKLLLVNTGDMGDNILSINFISSLVSAELFDEIHLLVKKPHHKIKALNHADKIIPLDKIKFKRDPFYRVKFIKSIREAQYETVLNITPERGILNETLTVLSGAGKLWLIKKKDRYINRVIKWVIDSWYEKIFHCKSDNEIEILREIGLHLDIKTTNQDTYPHHNKTKKIITMAPLASDHARSWALHKFLEVNIRLSEKYKIYLLGTEEQFPVIESLVLNTNIKNLSGKLNIDEVSDLIEISSLFIGNDSGLTHMALLNRTPLIALTGGGMYGRFFPYSGNYSAKYLYYKMDCFGCRWECIYKEKYCLQNVSVTEVLITASRLLEENAD